MNSTKGENEDKKRQRGDRILIEETIWQRSIYLGRSLKRSSLDGKNKEENYWHGKNQLLLIARLWTTKPPEAHKKPTNLEKYFYSC